MMSYETRLRLFEAEKRELEYRELTPTQYQTEIQKIAKKYGI